MTRTSPSDSPTRVDVRDLLDSPGATRRVSLRLPVPEGFEVPLSTIEDEVAIDGSLDGLVDGVLLRGTLSATVAQTCAACLTPIAAQELQADVQELFSEPDASQDTDDVEAGYLVEEGAIELDALLRDALAELLPPAPRCRPDCAGLCATCGSDRNTVDCDCEAESVDDRWAALAELRIDP